MNSKVHNFCAGPCLLPQSVYQQAAQAILDYNNSGVSILSISHRSPEFIAILQEAQSLALSLLGLDPKEYVALFLQGGASMEFLRVPYNFLHNKAAYINTGVWARKAIEQARGLGDVSVVWDAKDSNYSSIARDIEVQGTYDYLHFTSNNTIYGTQFAQMPRVQTNTPLICDMSSDIYSREFPYNEIDLIYAGAQKNIGPAGLSVVIARRDFLQSAKPVSASMLHYQTHALKDSLYHTANVFAIYTTLLNLRWLRKQGGVASIEQKNNKKAALLYTTLDSMDFLEGIADKESRSKMNVTWRFKGDKFEQIFDVLAKENQLVNLKGHREIGGYRASLYNAMDIESVEVLCQVLEYTKHKI